MTCLMKEHLFIQVLGEVLESGLDIVGFLESFELLSYAFYIRKHDIVSVVVWFHDIKKHAHQLFRW